MSEQFKTWVSEQFETWMIENDVKRVVRLNGGWAVYLADVESMGTGDTIESALEDAEERA